MATELHRSSDATVRIEGIPYRAESGVSDARHQANVEDGQTRTATRLDDLGRSCPQTKFALVGVSQGAEVLHKLAAGPTAQTLRRIRLIALIADSRRNPDDSIQSWTYGTTAPGAGKLGAGPVLDPSLQDIAITFCVAGDAICGQPPGDTTDGPSEKHRKFYEDPAHAQETGQRMAAIVRRTGI
ncbi:cutinase family protein [Aeromicrobium sp. A1-2]|uniref:cutinase family protein n=1 Tax=Aeromicrobium sp. A1-2 TaxID=2107713 RepID=UPI0013C35F4B|nr:cutinase family protein [Aeromicrobium sp. A1-2]